MTFKQNKSATDDLSYLSAGVPWNRAFYGRRRSESAVSQMNKKRILKNDKGTVLVIAMFILVLLTLMGKSISTIATRELKISGNEQVEKRNFFAAEAGLGHIRAILQTEFTHRNQASVASGQIPDWDFALDGTVEGIQSAISAGCEGASIWINDRALGDGAKWPCKYTVTVWNNPEDKGGITDDTDQLLWVQSSASGPGGTHSSVAVLLRGQVLGEAITGYFAQAGSGAGGCHSSRDIRPVSDFTIQ